MTLKRVRIAVRIWDNAASANVTQHVDAWYAPSMPALAACRGVTGKWMAAHITSGLGVLDGLQSRTAAIECISALYALYGHWERPGDLVAHDFRVDGRLRDGVDAIKRSYKQGR